VVPGCGLSPGGARWVKCRPKFFLPARVLSRLFRGKFLADLATSSMSADDVRRAVRRGACRTLPSCRDLAETAEMASAWIDMTTDTWQYGGIAMQEEFRKQYEVRAKIVKALAHPGDC
jgi:hypothetical protein